MKAKRIFFGFLGLVILTATSCLIDEELSCSFPENAKLKRIVACRNFDSFCPLMECEDIAWIVAEYEYDRWDRIKKVSDPRYDEGVRAGVSDYQLYEYNSNGQLVKVEYYSTFRDEFYHEKNLIYTYSDDGKKIKEYTNWIEWGFQYKIFKYADSRLIKTENYERNTDELESYVEYEYNAQGNLIKETTYNKNGRSNYYIKHEYEDGLNIKSYAYNRNWGDFDNPARVITRTYDKNKNLILLESRELKLGSSKMSYRWKYEYYKW